MEVPLQALAPEQGRLGTADMFRLRLEFEVPEYKSSLSKTICFCDS